MENAFEIKGASVRAEKLSDDEDVLHNFELLDLNLKDKNWSELANIVGNISGAFSKPHNRKRLSPDVLNSLCEILEVAAAELKDGNTKIIAVVLEVFRAMRNSCVGERENQEAIVERTSALCNTCAIIRSLMLLSNKENNPEICLRVGTQFLGNLVVNNSETQPFVWHRCNEILIELLKYDDAKVANYSSMVIYNILLGCPDIASAVESYKELLEILIEHATKDSEFALFTIEMLLSRPGYLPKVYEKVHESHRLFLLDCLHSMITSDSKTSIPTSSLTFLIERFKTHSDCILKTCNNSVESLEPAEVSKLLQFLATACADSEYRHVLQKDKALLITCAMLLTSIHSLGKAGENNFSVIQKLANLSVSSSTSDIQEHPAFGFKSSLVQLLGNLCWRHKDNQDQVRELDCIPILLDCCNIDARNPLIIQWVVLAVRNLCENNPQNQSVIAAMSEEGVVDSKVLLEMGLTLHADSENRIVVVPLKKKT